MKALVGKYNAYPRENRHACYEELCDFKMERGQDAEDGFSRTEDLLKHSHRMEENSSDERYRDIVIQGLTGEYDYIRDTHHGDRMLGLEEMKTTTKSMYVGSLSRLDHDNVK